MAWESQFRDNFIFLVGGGAKDMNFPTCCFWSNFSIFMRIMSHSINLAIMRNGSLNLYLIWTDFFIFLNSVHFRLLFFLYYRFICTIFLSQYRLVGNSGFGNKYIVRLFIIGLSSNNQIIDSLNIFRKVRRLIRRYPINSKRRPLKLFYI
jgi:hypothetical protein